MDQLVMIICYPNLALNIPCWLLLETLIFYPLNAPLFNRTKWDKFHLT
jgi:hypothetical protein